MAFGNCLTRIRRHSHRQGPPTCNSWRHWRLRAISLTTGEQRLRRRHATHRCDNCTMARLAAGMCEVHTDLEGIMAEHASCRALTEYRGQRLEAAPREPHRGNPRLPIVVGEVEAHRPACARKPAAMSTDHKPAQNPDDAVTKRLSEAAPISSNAPIKLGGGSYHWPTKPPHCRSRVGAARAVVAEPPAHRSHA